jgi:hypothetical protein
MVSASIQKHEIVFPNVTFYNPAVKRLQIGEIK